MSDIKIRDRNLVLDAAKGIAIVLVVFGHEISTYTQDWQVTSRLWYWSALHHFHMALFFFICGYIAYGAVNTKWVKRRLAQLVPVYILWSIVLYYCSTLWFTGLREVYPTQGGLIKSLLYCTWSQDTSGLWFLPLLIALCILTYLTRSNIVIMFGIAVIAYVASQIALLSPGLLGYFASKTAWFSHLAWFIPFYISGYLISRYKEKLLKLYSIKWFALIAFPIIFIFAGELNYTTPLYSWPDFSIFTNGNFVFGFYRLLMVFLGIGMVFAVVKLLMLITITKRIFVHLGTITLGIYCASSLARNIGIGTGILWIVSATLVSLVVSSILIWALKKLKITNYLFLGGAQELVGRK